MKGEAIICFAKDRSEAPTSNHHVLRELARHNTVVWLDSVATRTPNLGSGRDLRKIFAKLGKFARGPWQDEDGVWVFTPLVLPLPHSVWATTVNRYLLRATIWALRKRLGVGAFQLWTFLPNVADYAGHLGESLLVYYCVDEWSMFHYIDRERMAAADERLTRAADVVFGACGSLVASRQQLNPSTFLAPHGVDHELFRTGLGAGPVPDDVARLPRPIVGFYGSVEAWVDLPLVAAIARRHPEWSVVLVGPVLTDTSVLDGLPNVHLLGRRSHGELPAYCRAFSVAIIPYVVDERMQFVNPLKLREYLSAGCPVVSTAIPEVQRYASMCALAHDTDSFEAAIEAAIRSDCPDARRERSEAMRHETWSSRVEAIGRQVTVVAKQMRRGEAGRKAGMQDTIRHRVGIVGAGAISVHHLGAIQSVPGAEVVGVVDLDEARSKKFAQDHGVAAYGSVAELVAAGATVIHVLTPPGAHAAVAIEAIERGCHVLVEKPLAESVEDAARIADAAARHGVVACVDHSLLFDPVIAPALRSVRAGAIGDVVSVDILRSSEYPPYDGGPLPPHYRRAGYPFRDLGVHALYVIQAFLGEITDVDASWRSLGGDKNLAFDEWRAVVHCTAGTGQVRLSWNVQPLQHQIVVQGTKGVLRLDLFSMFQTLRRKTSLPKAAERFLGGASDGVGSLLHMTANAARFASGAIRPFHGLRALVAAYYRHLDGNGPLPVSMDDAVRIVELTERVACAAERDASSRLGHASKRVRFLVTGASGALGSAIVDRLVGRGDVVRCFMRRPPAHARAGVEVVLGDLGDPAAVSAAVEGAEVVIHAGAAMGGSWGEHRRATIEGTRNVVDACCRLGVRKLVHISSLSVVEYADAAEGEMVNEDTPLEPLPEARGHYTRSKLDAEQQVLRGVRERGLSAVILRPGQIFGPGIPLVTPAVARRLGRKWLVLGDGEVRLPLVYLDDVVDAVVLAADGELNSGAIVQLTDAALTQNEVLARTIAGAEIVRLPRPLLFAAGKLTEPMFAMFGRSSPVSAYRLRSALAKRNFEGRNTALLGWRPRVGVLAGIEREEERGGLM